jgi:hypothetical protein
MIEALRQPVKFENFAAKTDKKAEPGKKISGFCFLSLHFFLPEFVPPVVEVELVVVVVEVPVGLCGGISMEST